MYAFSCLRQGFSRGSSESAVISYSITSGRVNLDLKLYLDFLRHRWLLLVLGPVVAFTAAYFFTQQLTPLYESTATGLVNRTATPGLVEYNDVLTSERLTNTYAELVESAPILDEVARRLGLSVSRRELDTKISVAPVIDTQLLKISVKDEDPAFATLLANTTAEAFTEDNASQLAPAGTVSIAKQAEVPESPVSPSLILNISFAIVLGGILAVCLGVLLDQLDNTLKSSEDVESAGSAPALALIGRFHNKQGRLQASEFNSRQAEAYRQLRTNLRFTASAANLKTIVITSANPQEGKSTTASNLAAVLAQAGDRVILVDADLRRSSLQKTFESGESGGLTSLLSNGGHDASSALVSTQMTNLRLLPAGNLPPNPSELLTSARIVHVMAALRSMADSVIFDTPPLLAVTDASVLSALADGTLLVAEAGRTRIQSLRQAAKVLTQANAQVTGVVLNKANTKTTGYYYYREEKKDRPSEVAVTAVPLRKEPAATQPLTRGEVIQNANTAAALRTSMAFPADSSQRGQALTEGTRKAETPPVTMRTAPVSSKESVLTGQATPVESLPRPSIVSESKQSLLPSNDRELNGRQPRATDGKSASSAAPPRATTALSGAVTDLLSHLDATVGLIRSLKSE